MGANFYRRLKASANYFHLIYWVYSSLLLIRKIHRDGDCIPLIFIVEINSWVRPVNIDKLLNQVNFFVRVWLLQDWSIYWIYCLVGSFNCVMLTQGDSVPSTTPPVDWQCPICSNPRPAFLVPPVNWRTKPTSPVDLPCLGCRIPRLATLVISSIDVQSTFVLVWALL